IEGRITETLSDGAGNPVSGLVFSILFALLDTATTQFQVVQHVDRTVTVKICSHAPLSEDTLANVRGFAMKYLPGVTMTIERVADIPLTAAGKRKIVVVER
ncbi:MAG: hypothetical protein ABI678_28320, partial [Kofleriaceae bacterium]